MKMKKKNNEEIWMITSLSDADKSSSSHTEEEPELLNNTIQ